MARYYNSQLVQPVSQFVPEPLALYQNKLEGMQKKQDAYKMSIAELNKDLDPLAIDRPRAAEKIQDIRSRLDEAQNINYNDPRQQKKAFDAIKGIRDEFSNFGESGAINARTSQYRASLKSIQDDKDLEPWMAESLINDLNKQVDPNNPNANKLNYDPKTGNYNQIKPPAKFNKVDPNKWLDDSLSQVHSDKSTLGLNYQGDAAAFKRAYLTGTLEHKDLQKIDDALITRAAGDRNLQTYLSKREEYDGINPNKENFFNVKQDDKGNQVLSPNSNTLLGSLISGGARGAAFKAIDPKYDFVGDELSLYKAKHAEDLKDINITTTSQSEGLPGSLVKLPSEIEDLQFENGKLKPIYTSDKKTIGLAGSSLNTPSGTLSVYNGKKFDEIANKNAIQLITNLRKDNPSLQNLNDEQVITAYKNSIKSLESESIPLNTVSNQTQKNIGEALSRNSEGRNFYLYDGKGKTIDGQKSTVLKQLGIKEEDFNKVLKNGIGGYTQSGPSAGAYFVEVPDSDGNSRRVMISQDNEAKQIFNASQQINEARKTLKKTTVEPHPGYSVTIEPKINADGKVDWTYTEMVKHPDGTVDVSPTTLDDIREGERQVYENSKYLGSQTGIVKPHNTQ